MKIMKKKMMGIFVCVLMLAAVPLAAGAVDSEQDKDTTDSIFGWTIIRGFIGNLKK